MSGHVCSTICITCVNIIFNKFIDTKMANHICIMAMLSHEEHTCCFWKRIIHHVIWIVHNAYLNVVAKNKMHESDQYDLRCLEKSHLSWDHDEWFQQCSNLVEYQRLWFLESVQDLELHKSYFLSVIYKSYLCVFFIFFVNL